MMIKKIGVLTSGGDAPGMNAAVRAVVKKASHHGIEVYGIYDGYAGLVEGKVQKLTRKDVGDIINRGGTFLGSARLPEFKEVEVRKKAIKQLEKHGIEAIVTIGGDGTYRGAKALTDMGINCIGLPGTIDNDIAATDFTIGFNTALNTIVEAVDKLRDTTSSHHRCSVIEVMGRHCGDLGIWSAMATGAEYIAIPEVNYDEKKLIDSIKVAKLRAKKHFIIIITERLTDIDRLSKTIEKETGIVTRPTILGHVQRGGSPSAFDRVLASKMGAKAVELLNSGFGGRCVSFRDNKLIHDDINEALSMKKTFTQELYQYAMELD